MRLFILSFLLIFMQGCVKSTPSLVDTQPVLPLEVDTQPVFPLEVETNGSNDSYEKFTPWHQVNKDRKNFTTQAEQSYAFLILNEAIRHDDFEIIIDASQAMLKNKPDSNALGDSVTWLLSAGKIKEARLLVEQGVKSLPNDLVMSVIYAEILLIEKENPDLALKILHDYVNRNPNEYIAQMELALFYLKIDQPKRAYAIFSKLPEKEKTPMVLYYTGFALKKIKRVKEAKKVFLRALREAPDFVEVILELAQIEENAKKYVAARKYYERVLELDAGNHDMVLRLMALSLIEGNPERALNLARNFGDSFNFVVAASSMLMDEGRVDLAEILLERIADMPNPPQELPFLQGSMAYEGSKNYVKALKYLNQITPEDKHYKNSLEMKVQIYLEQDDFENAFAVMEAGQATLPDEIDFYLMQYQLHLYLEQFEEALPVMEVVLAADPDDSDTAFRYAYVHDRVGEYEKSMELMEKLLVKDPSNYEVMNFIGYMLADRDEDVNRAVELLSKANELQPESDYIADSLAWAYYRKQEFDKAWELIQKAMNLSPQGNSKDPTMWDHYGDIASALGLKDEARTAWEKSLLLKDDVTIRQKINEK